MSDDFDKRLEEAWNARFGGRTIEFSETPDDMPLPEPPKWLDEAPPYPGTTKQKPSVAYSNDEKPLTVRAASLRSGADILPREWMYGVHVIRRYLTVLVAPGGVGKTALLIAMAAAIASGKRLIGDHVHVRSNVLICWLEDPEEEFDRRLAACMEHHKLNPEDLSGRVFTLTGRDRQLRLAALSEGGSVIFPDKVAMTEAVKQNKIGCIMVDPFINSHELDENSNVQINAAARAWAEIGNETGCGVVLVHHSRKGASVGDIEAGRGAKALTDAARVGLTLTAMTDDEAKAFNIPEKDRRRYVRLDDAKQNLAPASEQARWFHLAGFNLGNATEAYPNGDNVQVIEEWEPPKVFDEHTPEQLNQVLDVVAEGPSADTFFTNSRRGGGARWVGNVLMDMLDVGEDQAKRMVKTWINTGLLRIEQFKDPATRKIVDGLQVNDTKRPTV